MLFLPALRLIAKVWVQSRDELSDPAVPPRGTRWCLEKTTRTIKGAKRRRAAARLGGCGQNRANRAARPVAARTAQRREKLLTLRWDDIDAKGVWTIRTEEREKGNAGALQLPKIALDIIQAQPRFDGNPMSLRAKVHAPGLLPANDDDPLDAQSGVTGWRLHDRRRTARSLMSLRWCVE